MTIADFLATHLPTKGTTAWPVYGIANAYRAASGVKVSEVDVAEACREAGYEVVSPTGCHCVKVDRKELQGMHRRLHEKMVADARGDAKQ